MGQVQECSIPVFFYYRTRWKSLIALTNGCLYLKQNIDQHEIEQYTKKIILKHVIID